MKRLLSILRLILRAKLIFKNPDNSKIVVFDDTSIKDFNNILLKRKYFLLKCRIENMSNMSIDSGGLLGNNNIKIYSSNALFDTIKIAGVDIVDTINNVISVYVDNASNQESKLGVVIYYSIK